MPYEPLKKGMSLQGETYKFILTKGKEKRMEPIPIEVTGAAVDLRALVGRLSRRLRPTSIGGEIALSQASVLSLLERGGPATPDALATMARISPQSMRAVLVALD